MIKNSILLHKTLYYYTIYRYKWDHFKSLLNYHKYFKVCKKKDFENS